MTSELRQNQRLQDLENEAQAGVDSFKTLADRLDVERKRNDVQAARIKALTALCEKLVERLTASGAVPAADLARELADVRKASEPVKL